MGNDEDYIEAKINLEPTNRTNKAKQNIISIGQGIDTWSTSNDGKFNLHFYYPNSSKNDHLLRFSAVIGEKVNGITRRTMGVIKIPNELITLRVDKNGISIDGHYISLYNTNNLTALKNSGDDGNYKYITEDDKPENTYQYFIDNYLSINQILQNLEVGSLQGNVRSWAYYDYIMCHLNID